MNKKLIIGLLVLIIILVGLWLLGSQEKENDIFTIEEAREIAENWIENESPTYLFDGENLTLLEESELVESSIYSFLFSFQSRSAGYGDRTDEITAQVITDHEIEVVVDNREVITAITDGVFSEIEERMIVVEESNDLMTINLFFGRMGYEENLFSIEREIEATEAVAREALNELISGPNEEEREEGYFSSINEETRILSLTVEDGTAYVDFSSHLQEGVAGSAMVTFIRNQIEETLMQFPTVDEVVISIEGEIEDILQP